jgi:hypothetical protein
VPKIPYTGPLSESSLIGSDPRKREHLRLKRWFYNDWCAIDPKLRTSIAGALHLSLDARYQPNGQGTLPPKQCQTLGKIMTIAMADRCLDLPG